MAHALSSPSNLHLTANSFRPKPLAQFASCEVEKPAVLLRVNALQATEAYLQLGK
ncbi:hypothetical protein HDF13_002858 [Edaphobacter lichenicola]|uniref:Uncharacterized protein n=1 Tax=Tunturiibacter gelidiferens TaxID=3069689 RepID=A0ACC5P161_9BACT|nr:hypothetical protein [Edaphobacter lichenicola]